MLDSPEVQVRTLPAYRRTVWGFRLLLAGPVVLLLCALTAHLLPFPARIVGSAISFGAGGVGIVLCWASSIPLMRFQRDVLGAAGMDELESGSFVWRLLFRDTFHRQQ